MYQIKVSKNILTDKAKFDLSKLLSMNKAMTCDHSCDYIPTELYSKHLIRGMLYYIIGSSQIISNTYTM